MQKSFLLFWITTGPKFYVMFDGFMHQLNVGIIYSNLVFHSKKMNGRSDYLVE